MIPWFLNSVPGDFSTKKPEIAGQNNKNSVNKRYISDTRAVNKNKKRPNNKSSRFL